ncbi:hypothetical protein OQA88_1215 [Cercophora sp. LCS_1]
MAKTSNGAEAIVLRKFGINERYQLAMYLLDQYRGTTVSCRYEISTRLAAAELQTAIKIAVVDVIMRHPMLQVGMIDAMSKIPSWIQLPSLDLTEHIKWVYLTESDDFERRVMEAFCAQLDEHFPDLSIGRPGWKVTIIRQGNAPVMEVLLTWNHPWFDAMGAKAFHEDLLEMLNAENGIRERTGLDGDILKLPPTPPLLPTPLEDLRNLPMDLRYLAKALWEETRPQFLNRDKSWAAWCPIRGAPYKTQFRAFFVAKPSLAALQALCRKNKTTITGLLSALALISFSLRLDATVAPAFQSATIVDHRRNLPPMPNGAPWGGPDRAVSNYVTQCFHRWDTGLVARVRSKLPRDAGEGEDLPADLLAELWTVAALNRREIVNKLEDALRNDIVGLFKYVTDWKQTMSNMAKRTRQFSWLVTNIGVMNGDCHNLARHGQGWSISRAQFGLSTEVPAAAIEFSPVSVAGRGMCVGASWGDSALDVTFGERILADMERWLAQLARQP